MMLEKVDFSWLRSEVEKTFARNRVTQARGKYARVTYHSPYAGPPVSYRTGLPSSLRFVYKMWWMLKAPWVVRYPHQWFWDSASHSIVLSHLDPDLAKEEIRSLIYSQDKHGFIPHMIWNRRRMHWVDRLLHLLYPSNHGSPFLQPPMLAQAAEQICHKTGVARRIWKSGL